MYDTEVNEVLIELQPIFVTVFLIYWP